MTEELLSLKWNNHQAHFVDILTFLREQEIFIDATLACGGKLYPAHKFVLSTCSDYFKQMFTKNPNKHPIVFMKDVSCKDLEALLDFMYNGEVNVPQSSLGSLIKTAEGLQIKGLAVPDDPPAPKRVLPRDRKERKLPLDDSYSPPPKRIRARDKSPLRSNSSNYSNNLNSRSKSPSLLSSPSASQLLVEANLDDNSRTSAHSGQSDNSQSAKPSQNSQNKEDGSQHDSSFPHTSDEPSAGTSGLPKPFSKVEVMDIKQEDVVDLGDGEEGDWCGEDSMGEGLDDRGNDGSLPNDNGQSFSDLGMQPGDGSMSSSDPAMTLLAQGMTPRTVAKNLLGSDMVCPVCFKTFTFPEAMTRHCQVHLPSRHRLGCHFCGKSFYRKDSYKIHVAKCSTR